MNLIYVKLFKFIIQQIVNAMKKVLNIFILFVLIVLFSN